MIVKCPLLVGLCSPVLAFEVLELLLWSEGALVASVALFVLMELVVRVQFLPGLPPYFAAGHLDKKLLLDEGAELGLSTLLIALLKASIVLARCVIIFRTSGPNSSSPVSLKSSLQISFKKELSLGCDLAILFITVVHLTWDI